MQQVSQGSAREASIAVTTRKEKPRQCVRHLSAGECWCHHQSSRLGAQKPVCIARAGHYLRHSSESKLGCSENRRLPHVICAKQRVPLIHTSGCHGVTSVCRQAPSSHHGGVWAARRSGRSAMPTGTVVPRQCRGWDETSAS